MAWLWISFILIYFRIRRDRLEGPESLKVFREASLTLKGEWRAATTLKPGTNGPTAFVRELTLARHKFGLSTNSVVGALDVCLTSEANFLQERDQFVYSWLAKQGIALATAAALVYAMQSFDLLEAMLHDDSPRLWQFGCLALGAWLYLGTYVLLATLPKSWFWEKASLTCQSKQWLSELFLADQADLASDEVRTIVRKSRQLGADPSQDLIALLGMQQFEATSDQKKKLERFLNAAALFELVMIGLPTMAIVIGAAWPSFIPLIGNELPSIRS